MQEYIIAMVQSPGWFVLCSFNGDIWHAVIPMKKAFIELRNFDGRHEFNFLVRNIHDNDT